jgi:hypothetical protein
MEVYWPAAVRHRGREFGLGRAPNRASPHLRLRGLPETSFYVALNNEFVGAKPLLVTGYLLGASKEMLTEHSRFIRIAPIKIIRDGAQPKAVKVYL